jgi:dynein heavy chain
MRERKEPSRFEQFQTEQMSYLQRSVNRLRNAWITSIKDIVEGSLKKTQSNWLTTTPDPSTYKGSKLKRYFTVVKFMMEDALRATAKNSFLKLSTFISDFIPESVDVLSIYEVHNLYEDGTVITPAIKNSSSHIPLF